jgi:hypothetical protein
MSLASLNEEEKEVVRRTMAATFDYFTFDFGTRIGVEQEEMSKLLEAWPDLDDSDDESSVSLAINNSMNDLLNGEGISESDAKEKIGVSKDEMRRVYKKWANARAWDHTGVI